MNDKHLSKEAIEAIEYIIRRGDIAEVKEEPKGDTVVRISRKVMHRD